MKPIGFPQQNNVLGRPACMTEEQCDALPVYVNTDSKQPAILSRWKLTNKEVKQIRETRTMWLWVFGHGMPPVALEVESPFGEKKERPEYITCMALPSDARKTWCGRLTSTQFVFKDMEHALNTINSGSRLLLCENCADAVHENFKVRLCGL